MHCACALNVYVDMEYFTCSPYVLCKFATFASTASVFMDSIAIKFLGFLEENIKYFSICPHQALMRY